MSTSYDASAIEVLTGLDPVRKRPGMYTDTTRPNHLAQEVIDNSVDEAIAGHAKKIELTLFKDGSIEVSDDGPGVDLVDGQIPDANGVGLRNTRERLKELYGDRHAFTLDL